MFPKQDRLEGDRLGNAIFLPLFGKDVDQKRTIFLDSALNPIRKQWRFLRSIRRVSARATRRAYTEWTKAKGDERHRSNDLDKVSSNGALSEGSRNDGLTALAGAMRRHGASKKSILAALIRENKKRCEPPLDEKELKSISKSISKYGPTESVLHEKTSEADRIVRLAKDVQLFHSPEKEPFASIVGELHCETCRLNEKRFRRWLCAKYYEKFGKVPKAQSVKDAVSALEGRALYASPESHVYIRVAHCEEKIFIDLGNPNWNAIEITDRGWTVISNLPVKFRRARGMSELPIPSRGGTIDELRPFLNTGSENDFVLLVSWMMAALSGRGPYPVLVLQGEAGSAKSSTARVLRALVDPNSAPLRSDPRDTRDLMIAAQNSWCVAFDNVSEINPWLSDALCRLSTGGGFSTRELYTDDEEKIFEATRPTLMNGIEGIVSRGDLLDRCLNVDLPVIPEGKRRCEKDFWHECYTARPRIFGALLNAISYGLHRLPSVSLGRLPRLADFAIWMNAVERSFGWSDGTFSIAYESNRNSLNALALEASPLVGPLKDMCAGMDWSGTATELLVKLDRRAGDLIRARHWPKTPWLLSIQLRRIAPHLRAAGLDVIFGKKSPGSHSKRLISISRISRLKSLAPAQPGRTTPTLCKPILRFRRDAQRFPREILDARDA